MGMIDKTWLDEDVANGMSSTTLVLGRGQSTVEAVRAGSCDWSLIPYAAPSLRSLIDETKAHEDAWLVAVVEADLAALNRDDAVVAYAPAWRKVPAS